MLRSSLVQKSRVLLVVALGVVTSACGASNAGESCSADSDCSSGLTCHERDSGLLTSCQKICTRLCTANADCANLDRALIGNAPPYVCGKSCGGDSICVDNR